jgi:hypothetical protein
MNKIPPTSSFKKYLIKNNYENQKYNRIGKYYIQRDEAEQNNNFTIRLFEYNDGFELVVKKEYQYYTRAVEEYEKLHIPERSEKFIKENR